jgi:hypothetical protein
MTDDDIVHCLNESFPSTVEIGEEIFRFIAKGKSAKSSDRIKEIGRLLMIFKCPRKMWEKPTIFSILTQDVGGGMLLIRPYKQQFLTFFPYLKEQFICIFSSVFLHEQAPRLFTTTHTFRQFLLSEFFSLRNTS